MIETSYRSARDSDAEQVSELLHRALLPNALPGWTLAAIEHLFVQNSPQALRERIREAAFAHVCLSSGGVAGFIISEKSRFLSLLAVDPSLQRRGIGSALVEYLLVHITKNVSDVSVVEVNASEYSLPFYCRRGFYPISKVIDYEGCRFVRLGYWRKNPLLRSPER